VSKLGNLKWESAVGECRVHERRLVIAKAHIAELLPLDADKLESLSDEECAWLDQFLYRFAKLQDAMGDRLFLTGLSLFGEAFDDRPFIDALNRLEALKLIPSREWWQQQREYRNQIAHEYPDRRREQCAAINAICEVCGEVVGVLHGMTEAVERRA